MIIHLCVYFNRQGENSTQGGDGQGRYPGPRDFAEKQTRTQSAKSAGHQHYHDIRGQ